jgi:hypothetical protein
MSETAPQPPPDEATLDLAIKQVLEGLSPAEQRAFDVPGSAAASAYARDFERAAAAVSLGAIRAAEAPPASLTARLEQQAQAYFASGAPASAKPVVEFRAPGTPPAAAPIRATGARQSALGWWAAAASLVLALFGWLRSPAPAPPPVAANPPTVALPTPAPLAPVPPAAPTPAEERAALAADPNSLKVALGATKDPAAAGVTGDVVWDPRAQRGFLRFVGMKPNDPQVHQYQLWIFDGGRDQRFPVDGGVFNVPADSAEVVIPIRATLPVHVAKAFAVTVEKPGGAVVSDREHVVALGQVT